MKKNAKKTFLASSTVFLLGLCILFGCTAQNQSSNADNASSTKADTEAATILTEAPFDVMAAKLPGVNEYRMGIAREQEIGIAEAYPYQFWTYATEKYREGLPFGHSTNQGKVEGPWVRDWGGGQPVHDEEGHLLVAGAIWDKATNTWKLTQPSDYESYGFSARCYACKSVQFNGLYEKYGADAFAMTLDQEVMDFVDGKVWSCGSCHEDPDNPDSNATPQHIFFNTVIHEDGDTLSMGSKVCGQCHNSTTYSGRCKDDDYFKTIRPFRYGFDADSMMKAMVEDGIMSPDDNGITHAWGMHADVELLQNGNHASLGVDCVSCHMPTMTAEDGTTFTDHDASQSPLENSVALEFCLTCHKGQGIADADAMVAMVREKQKEAADLQNGIKDQLPELEELIIKVTNDGSVDEATLAAMNDNYTRASFYVEYTIGSYAKPGVKIAHNPVDTFDYLSRAQKLIDDALTMAK